MFVIPFFVCCGLSPLFITSLNTPPLRESLRIFETEGEMAAAPGGVEETTQKPTQVPERKTTVPVGVFRESNGPPSRPSDGGKAGEMLLTAGVTKTTVVSIGVTIGITLLSRLVFMAALRRQGNGL